jgi:hypothetical protein
VSVGEVSVVGRVKVSYWMFPVSEDDCVVLPISDASV